jgi:formimidoylglutamate deiminase
MLPVLYERAGFSAPDLRDDQRRFHTTPELVFRMSEELSAARRPLLNAGIAIHSLRAASAESVGQLRALWAPMNGPIHIHVAEQMQEVNDCLESTGERPVAWLASHGVLDERVQLVHARHTEPEEIAQTAQSGAGVVLCPSTEANLGDGLCDLPGWLAAEVPLSLGSDSHVTRSFCEELRLLEYGQRLAQQKRNVSAAPEQDLPATAERLYARVLAGGAQAAGLSRWGLSRGARADALVVDGNDSGLRGIPLDHMLDALVFASPVRPFRDVMVAGEWVVKNHVHSRGDAIARRFSEAMAELFS